MFVVVETDVMPVDDDCVPVFVSVAGVRKTREGAEELARKTAEMVMKDEYPDGCVEPVAYDKTVHGFAVYEKEGEPHTQVIEVKIIEVADGFD